MKRVLLLLVALGLTSCAGTQVVPDPQVSTDVVSTTEVYPILDKIEKKAQEVEDWIANGVNKPVDPVRIHKAHMCPDFLIVAVPSLKEKIGKIAERKAMIEGKLSSLTKGEVNGLLELEILRYGEPQIDPEADLKDLKNYVLEIGTGVVDACKSVLPMKEFNWVIEKAAGFMIK